MTDMRCGGMYPIELSSSTNAVSLPCPSREHCMRYSKEVKLPAAVYYNRFEGTCQSFIGNN